MFKSHVINTAVNDFTSILATAGRNSLKLKENRTRAGVHKIKQPWFDQECYMNY